MATVTLLEAYFGSGVILDWSDDSGRDAAFRLALLTLANLERVDPVSPAVDATLAELKKAVVPATRYSAPTTCTIGSSRYRFNVLSEDGSALEVGPAWEAPNDWYLEFWNTLWKVSQQLENTLPSFRLLTPHGERKCTEGHPLSPFAERCEECEQPPNSG